MALDDGENREEKGAPANTDTAQGRERARDCHEMNQWDEFCTDKMLLTPSTSKSNAVDEFVFYQLARAY